MLSEIRKEYRAFVKSTGLFRASNATLEHFSAEYRRLRVEGMSQSLSRAYAGVYAFMRGEGKTHALANKCATAYAASSEWPRLCWIQNSPKREVSSATRSVAAILARSVQWRAVQEIAKRRVYLVRGVPIALFAPASRNVYAFGEGADDSGDSDEMSHLERYDAIADKLKRGGKPWPVLVDVQGAILDGFHRLAVLSDLGVKYTDVLWIVPR
jgi:hypothetical protein